MFLYFECSRVIQVLNMNATPDGVGLICADPSAAVSYSVFSVEVRPKSLSCSTIHVVEP